MQSSTHSFKAWLFTFVVMLVIDALWLGVVARDLYQHEMGSLMATQPRWLAAAAFYLAYPLGLVVFAVRPALAAHSTGHAMVLGGMFGLFAYGTYDLTNLSVVRGWPLALSLVDMAWGCAVSGVSAAVGAKALLWFANRA